MSGNIVDESIGLEDIYYQNEQIIKLLEQIASNTTPKEKPKRGTENPNKGKHRHGTYKHVLLTDDEYGKCVEIFGSSIFQAVEKLDTYIEQTGKSYRNHYLVMMGWVRDNILGKQQETVLKGELF